MFVLLWGGGGEYPDNRVRPDFRVVCITVGGGGGGGYPDNRVHPDFRGVCITVGGVS